MIVQNQDEYESAIGNLIPIKDQIKKIKSGEIEINKFKAGDNYYCICTQKHV